MRERKLATFCKELAIMVRAGMTLEEAIEFIEQDSEDDWIKQVIKKVKSALKDGMPMDKALQSTEEFPDYMLYMIKVGRASNQLGEVLELVSNKYLREARLKENLKRAINYPIYLGSIMLVVMLFLTLKVLPTFNEVFIKWDEEITQGAETFLKLGRISSYCTIGVFIGTTVLSLVGVFLIKTKRGWNISCYIAGHTGISEKINTARFAWVMGTMLKSGLSLEESLQRSMVVLENKTVKQKVKRCIQLVSEKNLFEHALGESKIFPKATTRLLVNSFKNSQLQETIKQVGEEGERHVQYMLENKVLAIETISVAVTSVIIGGVLMTIMLPLMSILMMLT